MSNTSYDFEVLRLNLLSKAWLSHALPGSLLDNHEANAIYLKRAQLRPSFRELLLLLRTMVADQFGCVPGWYCLKSLPPYVIDRLLVSLALDSYQVVRERAYGLLREARIPLPRDDNSRDLIAGGAVSGVPAEVRRAAVAYLGSVGGHRELQEIERALIDDDPAVGNEALKSKLLILCREDPGRAFAEIVADPNVHTQGTLKELAMRASDIPSEDLVNALLNGNDQILVFAASQLKERGELTVELARDLSNNPSEDLSSLAREALLELGIDLDAEEI